jgi:hypothetical protein
MGHGISPYGVNIMAYEIARTFAKRETENSNWSGKIGVASLFVSDDGTWTMDGKVLPRKSVEYLLTFSLQSLQDAYAGAESLAEATANWSKKHDALIDGTIGSRGGGADDETKVGRKLVLARLIAKYGKDSEQAAATPEQLDEVLAKNAAAFAPLVAKEMARLEAARKERAAMAAELGELDI